MCVGDALTPEPRSREPVKATSKLYGLCKVEFLKSTLHLHNGPPTYVTPLSSIAYMSFDLSMPLLSSLHLQYIPLSSHRQGALFDQPAHLSIVQERMQGRVGIPHRTCQQCPRPPPARAHTDLSRACAIPSQFPPPHPPYPTPASPILAPSPPCVPSMPHYCSPPLDGVGATRIGVAVASRSAASSALIEWSAGSAATSEARLMLRSDGSQTRP